MLNTQPQTTKLHIEKQPLVLLDPPKKIFNNLIKQEDSKERKTLIDILEQIKRRIRGKTIEELYAALVRLAIFTPQQTISFDEYEQHWKNVHKRLQRTGNGLHKELSTYKTETKFKTLIYINDKDPILTKTLDFSNFFVVCCSIIDSSSTFIPQFTSENAFLLYELLKQTPYLYEVDKLDLQSGVISDSGRVVISSEMYSLLQGIWDNSLNKNES